ncbi:TIGR03758 family integrating conjugative element protein [Pantoea sp. RIT-PI-b]|uniref:TIGR03758 family integrating conjugative element protein n=1 Tax=Pantoea sp. RIT-PI-b TaxID=1681195 RepID=UPI0009E63C4C
MKTSTSCVLALIAIRSIRVRSRWIRARSALEAVRYGDGRRADQHVKTVSGNIDISVLYLVPVGLLLCVLFLWAAWAALDVWHGWEKTKVKDATLVRFFICSVALLIV